MLASCLVAKMDFFFLLKFITFIVIHLSNCVSIAILVMPLDIVKVRQADWGLFMFLTMGNCYFYKCQKSPCFHRAVKNIVNSRAAKCEDYFKA